MTEKYTACQLVSYTYMAFNTRTKPCVVFFIYEVGWLRLMDTTWATEMISTCRRQIECLKRNSRTLTLGYTVSICVWNVSHLCTGMRVMFVHQCLIKRKSRKHFPSLQVLFTPPLTSYAKKFLFTHKAHTDTHIHALNTHANQWKMDKH